MLELALLLPVMAAINRVRGGGCSFFSRLPGHTRFYASGLMALTAAPLVSGPIEGVLVGVAYLCWSWLPWGRWYDLGALEGYPNRPPSRFEELLSKVAKDDATAFTARNLLGLIPAAVLLSPLFLLLALFQTAAYGVGWKLAPTAPIRLAELLTGALWGFFVWALV